MESTRPTVFIGSSAEGLPVAEAIQLNLDRACEVVIWSQGVFGLSSGTLESLVDKLDEFDFAILVLTPDDLLESRGKTQPSPRDNVLIELGLFIGVLGRKRTFIVYDRTANLKIPSDLAGATAAAYQLHKSGDLQPALGAACTQMRLTMAELGRRQRAQPDFDVDQNTQFQIIYDLLSESARQFIIAMHEKRCAIYREASPEHGIQYKYHTRHRSGGRGFFSVDRLCSKLADAGLLEPDLRNKISLTDRGHEFAAWMVERGHKAAYFESDIASWGERPQSFLWAVR